MAYETIHEEDTLQFIEIAEETFGVDSIDRANRGPSIQTSMVIEMGTGSPVARMNLYGPSVLLARASEQNTSIRAYSPQDDFYLGAYPETLNNIRNTLPAWARDLVYIANVNVLNQADRNQGIGTTLLRDSLFYYYEKAIKIKQHKAIGVTNNPVMLSVATSLGGEVSNLYTVLGVKTDVVVPRVRRGTSSDLILVDVGITSADGIFSIGFSVLYDSWNIYGGIVAIVIPERNLHDYESGESFELGLLGQMLIIIDPEMDKTQFSYYEKDIYRLASSHRWANIIQASNVHLGSYSGTYLKVKEDMSVFEIKLP